MIYNRFSIKVIIRIVVIALTSYLFTWSLGKDNLIVTKFTLVLIWIAQILDFIHYVNKTNRQLNQFLQSLKYRDFVSSSNEKDKSFKELNLSYNEIINEIKEAKIETASQQHYLRNTIENLGVGVITFDESGDVELINHAARDILGIRQLKNIHSLQSLKAGFPTTLINLPFNQPKLITLEKDNELLKLSFKRIHFRIRGSRIQLISIQNIKSELEEEELEAWQKLIRVLSHEIMNSVTPVKSLTNTIINMFEKQGTAKQVQELNNEIIHNSLEGLHAIENRSKGLLNFIESYRKLTRLPKPQLRMTRAIELFTSIIRLMDVEIAEYGITIETDVTPEDLTLFCDERLINQVLINLVTNSLQALKGRPNGHIYLSGSQNKDEIFLKVSDNGPGILPEILDKIFIPFYTTKESGSGIGLSLSKQLMRQHNGTITVHSIPNEQTVFTLKF
jgi:two-component system nitrogen regulation sensor histidine kinase NtrY